MRSFVRRSVVDRRPSLFPLFMVAERRRASSEIESRPELDEPSDLEEIDPPDINEADWEAFIADDDERDPLPEPGDFWIECDSIPQRDAA